MPSFLQVDSPQSMRCSRRCATSRAKRRSGNRCLTPWFSDYDPSVSTKFVGNSAQILCAGKFLGHASPNVYVDVVAHPSPPRCKCRNVRCKECMHKHGMNVFSSFVLLQRLSSKVAAKIDTGKLSSLLTYGTDSRTLEPKPRQQRIVYAVLSVCAGACWLQCHKRSERTRNR